jgi:outer membrane protein assembly factor BamB
MARPRTPFVLLALLPLLARADDWPQWRGPDRTGHVPAGVPVPQTLPAAPPVLWQAPLGNGLSSPVVAGGKVFCPDDANNKETLHAFDAATGKPLWSVSIDALHKDSQSPAGPRCTPVADGDRVYHQSCRGELQCLAAADGHVIWSTNYVRDFGATFVGEKGNAAGDVVVVASHQAGLIAINVTADNETFRATPVWTAKDSAINFSSPVAVGRHLYGVGPRKNLICVDLATGRQTWSNDQLLTGDAGRAHAGFLVMNDRILMLSDGGRLILFAADPAAYKELARAQVAGTNWCTPAYAHGRLYFRDQKQLFCLNLMP